MLMWIDYVSHRGQSNVKDFIIRSDHNCEKSLLAWAGAMWECGKWSMWWRWLSAKVMALSENKYTFFLWTYIIRLGRPR